MRSLIISLVLCFIGIQTVNAQSVRSSGYVLTDETCDILCKAAQENGSGTCHFSLGRISNFVICNILGLKFVILYGSFNLIENQNKRLI